MGVCVVLAISLLCVLMGDGSWTVCFFFFSSRRRHTRFDCDWSSDVCSSDLTPQGHPAYRRVGQAMHRLIAEHAGHAALAAAMSFADHSEVALERLEAERAAERRRAKT